MKRWQLPLIGLCMALALVCGVTAYQAIFIAPSAFVPSDATDVQIQQVSYSHYEMTYHAARPLREWRLGTIQRLSSQGWARGRLPDSNRFDRTLWFVRRRSLGFMSVLEQVSIQSGGGDTPPVLVTYRRTISAPIIGRWLGR